MVYKKVSVTSMPNFTVEQIHKSQELLSMYGGKTNVFYSLLFERGGRQYIKFGIVYLRPFQVRFFEHLNEFGKVCCILAVQCEYVHNVESEFKKSSFFIDNKADISKSDGFGGKHKEILKLNKNISIDAVKKQIMDIAGDRIISESGSTSDNVVSTNESTISSDTISSVSSSDSDITSSSSDNSISSISDNDNDNDSETSSLLSNRIEQLTLDNQIQQEKIKKLELKIQQTKHAIACILAQKSS